MFVFGLGYVGSYVAKQLKREGWHVSGTCKDAIKKKDLEEVGLDAFTFEINKIQLKTLPTLQYATHILISIPPISGAGDPLLCLHEELRPLLSCGNLQWLAYLSSTSVYGDCGGSWVDEDSLINPQTESAKLRLAAEEGWLHLGRQLGFPVNIFRLGGIYGPGRSALDTITKNVSLSEKQKKRWSRLYISRIHVADIYQSINASFNIPHSGRIYNVVDDDPAPRAEVFAFAQGLIEKKMAGRNAEAGADIDPLWEYSAGEKLVSNARIKNELRVRLAFPSYRSGLESILSSFDL